MWSESYGRRTKAADETCQWQSPLPKDSSLSVLCRGERRFGMPRGIIKCWSNTLIRIMSDYSISFQLIMGFGLPILVNDQSITMGTVMKILYNVPINSSEYLDPIFNRDRRSAAKTSRWDLYSMLEVTCDR